MNLKFVFRLTRVPFGGEISSCLNLICSVFYKKNKSLTPSFFLQHDLHIRLVSKDGGGLKRTLSNKEGEGG